MIPTGRDGIVGDGAGAGRAHELDWEPEREPGVQGVRPARRTWVALEGVVTSAPTNRRQRQSLRLRRHGRVDGHDRGQHRRQTNVAADQRDLEVRRQRFPRQRLLRQDGHRFESDNLMPELRARGVTSGNPVNNRRISAPILAAGSSRTSCGSTIATRAAGEHRELVTSRMTAPRRARRSVFHTKVSYQMNPTTSSSPRRSSASGDPGGARRWFVGLGVRELLQ